MQAYHRKLIKQLQAMNLTYDQIGELTFSSKSKVRDWLKKNADPKKFMSTLP